MKKVPMLDTLADENVARVRIMQHSWMVRLTEAEKTPWIWAVVRDAVSRARPQARNLFHQRLMAKDLSANKIAFMSGRQIGLSAIRSALASADLQYGLEGQ